MLNNVELTDGMREWAESPMALVEGYSERVDVDLNRFVASVALNAVLNDDGNCFSWDVLSYDPMKATISKLQYEIRSRWETDVTGLPQEVSDLLRENVAKILIGDWGDKQTFENAKAIFNVMLKHLRNLQSSNNEVGEEMRTLSKYYLKIVYGI